MSVITIIFIIVVAGIIFYAGKQAIQIFKRNLDIHAILKQLKSEGYKVTELYKTEEFEHAIAYDLKKKMLLYIVPDQPTLVIPFRKIKDCTIVIDGIEQSQLRVSHNKESRLRDGALKHWLNQKNDHKGFELVELNIELAGFTPSELNINFSRSSENADESIETYISTSIIRWYKIIRKLIENNQTGG